MDDYVRMPSGLILPEAAAEKQLRATRRPRAMDFFAGAGGFSLGFIQAGWEVVAANEMWPTAVMTYMTNLCRWGEVTVHFVTDQDRLGFEKDLAREYKKQGVKIVDGTVEVDGKLDVGGIPLAGEGWIKGQPRSTPGVSHVFVGDVRKLTGESISAAIGIPIGGLDGVCGGPPCQGYSISGKRDVMDPRNSLVFEYARIICELRPKTMVMEEVPNILNMVTPEGVSVIDRFCQILEEGGFGTANAFSRAVKAQADSMGFYRGKGKPEEPEGDQEDESEPPGQMDMFAEAANA